MWSNSLVRSVSVSIIQRTRYLVQPPTLWNVWQVRHQKIPVIRLCWLALLTVTMSVKTLTLATLSRLAAADLTLFSVHVSTKVLTASESLSSSRRNQRYATHSSFSPALGFYMLSTWKDLEIVCGQFDSDTEIATFSKEVEEVFQVTEIINHPDYQPHKVKIKWKFRED